MQVAIEHALTVLSWYENCLPEEIPPERLWEDSDGLEMWWATVKDKRDAKYGITPESEASNEASDAGEWPEAGPSKGDQGPENADNDIARSLRAGW